MIGSVRNLEPIIPVQILDASGQWWWLEAVLDTGSTCSLSLPPSVIRDMGLSWFDEGGAVLAGNRRLRCNLYVAHILWNGIRRRVHVHELPGDPLVGNRLLMGHRINIDLIEGGAVEVTPLNHNHNSEEQHDA